MFIFMFNKFIMFIFICLESKKYLSIFSIIKSKRRNK